ncbi:divalent-cation tolerance protein CutA [Prosthecochloris sp. SCSIO W1101]|uniref:divalent-cation tolerance protein CutA n=1 Tax=Prosthecochloris sp. SCSIO W1101 TaxID=2992242 RepID=UPI00223D31CE|nr:divalent-cation tolerance protein CutA [Prosthecochloris sp. SCSIO W1101]UZJ40833.1 divalent-cation tolerance protein CutA [Prosthecochloris sp. SCSIO W1101]
MDTLSYCLVITTAPDMGEADMLAEGLLNEGLAACVHLQDIRSRYIWEKKLCRNEETVLWIKTLEKHYETIEMFIQRHHPYELPEIIKIPITGGLSGYLQWIADTADGSGAPDQVFEPD